MVNELMFIKTLTKPFTIVVSFRNMQQLESTILVTWAIITIKAHIFQISLYYTYVSTSVPHHWIAEISNLKSSLSSHRHMLQNHGRNTESKSVAISLMLLE